MEIQVLDFTLVPLGLALLIAYHLWLLRETVWRPAKTVIGVNAINRRFWVQSMMEDPIKNGVLSVQTLRNNIMASTVLASTAITLSSLIAVVTTSNKGDRATMLVVIGDRSDTSFTIKFFCIIACFLVAFLLTVQSIRFYSHASMLINVPVKKLPSVGNRLTTEYVVQCVNKGGYFWSLGLRAFYFSCPIFLWIFGPIPMFACCVLMVMVLYFLDFNYASGWVVSQCSGSHRTGVDEEVGPSACAAAHYETSIQHVGALTRNQRVPIICLGWQIRVILFHPKLDKYIFLAGLLDRWASYQLSL